MSAPGPPRAAGPIRIGIVGCGKIAEHHLRGMAHCNNGNGTGNGTHKAADHRRLVL